MRTFITASLAICSTIISAAQETADTISTQQLQEVVIEAPKVIRKADMDVFLPSASAVENAKNGIQLLNNLMIPSLSVTEALGSIKAAGQDVQVRINGREASVEQVKSLLPETIKRVEWIDNPGLRYKGANYVLNFIVTNPTAGGSLQTQAQPALNVPFGFYSADLKLNHGHSQWSVGANYKLTNKLKTHRDYSENFFFPDGTSLKRTETPLDGHIDNSTGYAWLSYDYIKPDTTVFYVRIQDFHAFSNNNSYFGKMTLDNDSENLLLRDNTGNNGSTPRISAYLEQHFAGKQTLVVDFQASMYLGKSFSDYQESIPDATEYITDIHTLIKDRNQAYAIEADYIKNWNSSRVTAGASYNANRNRSTYENLGGQIFHQRQDRVYFFTEYFQRINKFTITAGLGAQYTSFRFRETNQGRDSWNLRPQATVSYRVNDNHQLRLSFQSWQSTPSLSETNITPQQVDGFQWHIGNPNLKTSNSYMLSLRYNFNVPRVYGLFGIRAFTSPNAITPLLYWDDNRLVTTYENSRGLQNLSFYIAPQVDIIPGWLMASGYLQYRMEQMKGTGYKLHNYNWSGSASLNVTHWGFNLSCMYNRAQRDLWGEKISWGEDISIIDLSYNMKNWQFGAGMIMPFGRYDQGSKMISKLKTNEQHMRIDMRIPYVRIGYNLKWGRQKRGSQKLINADADVSTSKTAGR